MIYIIDTGITFHQSLSTVREIDGGIDLTSALDPVYHDLIKLTGESLAAGGWNRQALIALIGEKVQSAICDYIEERAIEIEQEVA
jgi:hypothetical protein